MQKVFESDVMWLNSRFISCNDADQQSVIGNCGYLFYFWIIKETHTHTQSDAWLSMSSVV